MYIYEGENVMQSNKIRWGVIGAGGFADKVAIPAIQRTPSCTVQALAVLDKERARTLGEKHGVPEVYDNAEQLIASQNVDVVYICTPDEFHAPYTILAAKNAKHVCCEKPMALSAEECQQMINACNAADVKLMPAFMMRFHPSHRNIQNLISQGELGKIVQVRVQCSFWYPDNGNWRQYPISGGGGALWDLGSHAIDLLRFLLRDEIREVEGAIVDTTVHAYQGNDIATCLLRFQQGTVGIVDVSFSIPHNHGVLEIYGTEGSIYGQQSIGHEVEPRAWLTQKTNCSTEITIKGDKYAEQFEYFSQCVRDRKNPEVTGYDGMINVCILQAIERAAQTGQRVYL